MGRVQPRRDNTPVFPISVVSFLSGLSPRQLRELDKGGIVSPTRTEGGRRLYSETDLRRAQVAGALISERRIGNPGTRAILTLCEAFGYAPVIEALELKIQEEEEAAA